MPLNTILINAISGLVIVEIIN